MTPSENDKNNGAEYVWLGLARRRLHDNRAGLGSHLRVGVAEIDKPYRT